MDFVNLKTQYTHNKKIINKSIIKVLNSSKFIMGDEVKILENKLKKITNSKYCLTVSSGTNALLLSLMAIGIKKNDEVIIPNFNYISSVEAVSLLGGKPILIDVNMQNGLIDENLIEKKINSKTKAIIPSSLFGLMPNYIKIKKILNNYKKIILIEDAAQSFGSSLQKIKSCGITTIGCTSFFPTKGLGAYGDGGAIFTSNKKIYENIYRLRSHGQKEKYKHDILGTNSRMDTIQCAIVLAKLKFFNKERIIRKRIFTEYKEYLEKNFNSKNLKLLKIPKNNISNYSYFCLIVKKREKLIRVLKKNGIPYNIYYPRLVSQQKAYFDKKITEQCINGKILCNHIIALPINAYMSRKEWKKIKLTFSQFKKVI